MTLWSRQGRLLDRKVRPNATCAIDDIRRLDADGIAAWLIETLASHRSHPIEAIIPVAHGAGVAALLGERLGFAPLDYEQPIPNEVMDSYRSERDIFQVTGSPALPDGLNLGAQLYWLERLCPKIMKDAVLVPWAQYWAWFLSGRAASEVTSLGCHTDLWSPLDACFSPMAERLGWATRFAPVVPAGTVVGTLRAELARATGLSDKVQILAGLHDSNAALLAASGFDQIAGKEATILSTGTWFIAMRLQGAPQLDELAEGRDCLVNVDAYGSPVPSARFMGGREIETIIGIDSRQVDIKPDQAALIAAVPPLLAKGTMLLPTLAPGCGPFPNSRSEWIHPPENEYARRTAACLYAALVADASLDLIGSRERLLVEGRFADAEVFVRALATLRPEAQVFTANAHNEVSFGALRLIEPMLVPPGELTPVRPLDADLTAYRRAWRASSEAAA